jgi:hypothetical protein
MLSREGRRTELAKVTAGRGVLIVQIIDYRNQAFTATTGQ